MKLTLIFLVFTMTAAGQSISNKCDLTDAKSFFVVHNPATPVGERKKIDKALRESADLRQAAKMERSDLLIDFSGPDLLAVWRNTSEGRFLVDRWTLSGSSATATLPGSIHSTTVYTRNVATSHTTIIPPRQTTVTISPEINTASEFLFNLRIRRKACRAAE